jgi:putative colanic acid biosynthesis acetyltransferase WcaF
MPEELFTYQQQSRTRSPRPLRERLALLLWEAAWGLLCAWTPKPFSAWRVLILRSFGARIYGKVFVHQRARIEVPWNLIMHDGSCIGDRANIYSLAPVELGERALVAQESYLCTGTHAFEQPNFPLAVAKITIGADCFLGARTFVLPGINIAEGAVTGACSVVTDDLPPWMVCVGNPCRPIKERKVSS